MYTVSNIFSRISEAFWFSVTQACQKCYLVLQTRPLLEYLHHTMQLYLWNEFTAANIYNARLSVELKSLRLCSGSVIARG